MVGPSLNALKAFEVAARSRSLTRAAREMRVTQAAISRHVRTLEEYLEVRLFNRGSRSVQLTPEGARLFASITSAFSEIEQAVSVASRRGRRDVLSVRTNATVAQQWLIPRLASFHAQYPNIEVLLSTSHESFNFSRDHIDVAIRYAASEDELSHLAYDFVAPYCLTPVCSPDLLKGGTVDPLELLRTTTLLHSIIRPRHWEMWLSAAGLRDEVDPNKGLKFQVSAMAYDAAMRGIGIAMGVQCLVADDLQLGRLVAPFDCVHPDGAFYLTYPNGAHHPPGFDRFRSWIRESIGADWSPRVGDDSMSALSRGYRSRAVTPLQSS